MLQQRFLTGGFTYIGLLLLVAIMNVTLAMAATLWSFALQREKERELLFAGNQFRQAIGLYYEQTPGTVKHYPHKLKDLIRDDRYLNVRRYLRQIYQDPMTGKTDWQLIPAPDGGIMGVYSNSDKSAVKTRNFRYIDRMLEGKTRYAEWEFAYLPQPEHRASPSTLPETGQ
jgi:Type II secretory pathway, pseudopilin PulG